MRPDRRFREPRHRLDGWRRAAARPWDVDPPRPDPAAFDGPIIPLHGATTDLEPELAALSAELAIAGSRARVHTDPDLAPGADFAASLRDRLLAQLPQPAPVAAAGVGGAVAVPAARPSPTALFDHLAAPRWTALAAAAVIVFAAIGVTTDRVVPVAPQAHVASASGATIRHDGTDRAATAGATIAAGDTVTVGSGGQAVLAVGESEARLGSDASVEVDRLATDGIELVQLAGRVYHRVDVPTGASYVVRTASVSWTATGTAFDVDRELASGGERVTVLAVQHAITIQGPDLTGSLLEGRRAVVQLGGELPEVTIGDAAPGTLDDPWLVSNARRDREQGLPLGILAQLDLGDPSPTPSSADGPPGSAVPSLGSPEPTEPAASTEPAPTPAPTHSPAPTPKPTPRPTSTPEPTPTPRPEPTPSPLGLTVAACDGGVLLDRSTYGGDGFAKAVVLHGSSESIPATWPPSGGATTVATASTSYAAKTDGFFGTVDGGSTSYFRALILGSSNQVLAASPVRSAPTHAPEALGELTGAPNGGGIDLGWTPFGGPGDCFTTYKAVWSETSTSPSYFGERDDAVALAGQSTNAAHLDGFTSGHTYHVRVQAIRITSLGAFLVAQTGVTDVTMP
jgi:hypothetical protein